MSPRHAQSKRATSAPCPPRKAKRLLDEGQPAGVVLVSGKGADMKGEAPVGPGGNESDNSDDSEVIDLSSGIASPPETRAGATGGNESDNSDASVICIGPV